ncbi:hypothetical protein SGRIM128S_04618 [Streptomyces griseomycini]
MCGSVSSWPVMGVAISPGATALTVMPCSASSSAITWVSSPRPPLAAQYGAAPTRGWCSWTEVTLTMRPPSPCRIMCRAAFCPHRNGPTRSTSSTSRTVAGSSSRKGVIVPVPALLTSTSTRPRRSHSSSTVSAAAGSRVRSIGAVSARRPFARTSSAVRSAPSWSLCQVMPTSMPAAARRTAVARPMPESAPVITATLVRGADMRAS